jgi:glutaredoxin
MIDVTIYSKPGCHLCKKMKAQLELLQQQHPFRLLEVNILDDPADFERFKEEIPVIFIAGRKAFAQRIESREFLWQLEQAERTGEPHAT